MRTKSGFTLTEVLAVLVILAIVACIAYSVAEPMREQGRQSKCIAQMKNIHAAMQQYGNDYDYQPISGLGGLTFFPHDPYSTLKVYGLTKGELYCPNSPAYVRKTHGTTYISPLWAEPWHFVSAGEKSVFSRFANQLADNPAATPLLKCIIHDETYYWPRERHIDTFYARPFLIITFFDGHIEKGRFSMTRGRLFTR